MPALGGTERLLVPFGRTPQYSPDGKWLLYSTGGRGGALEAFIMPAAGGASQRLLADVVTSTVPAWSADSKSIVIRVRKTITDPHQLVVVKVDDRGVVAGPPRDSGVLTAIYGAGLLIEEIVGWRDGDMLFTTRLGAVARCGASGSMTGATAAVRPVYVGLEDISRAVVTASGRIFFSASATRVSIASIGVDGARYADDSPNRTDRRRSPATRGRRCRPMPPCSRSSPRGQGTACGSRSSPPGVRPGCRCPPTPSRR